MESFIADNPIANGRGKIISAYYVDTKHISGDPYPERIDPNTIILVPAMIILGES